MTRLLVAEEDSQVRALLCYILMSAGYQVTAVADGEVALAALLISPLQFAAAVLSQGLRGLNGTDVVARLRAVHPDFPVLLLSGRVPPPVGQHNGFLGKPFPPDALVEEMARLTAPSTTP